MANKALIGVTLVTSAWAMNDSGLGAYLVPEFMQVSAAYGANIVDELRQEAGVKADCVRSVQNSGEGLNVKEIAKRCNIDY